MRPREAVAMESAASTLLLSSLFVRFAARFGLRGWVEVAVGVASRDWPVRHRARLAGLALWLPVTGRRAARGGAARAAGGGRRSGRLGAAVCHRARGALGSAAGVRSRPRLRFVVGRPAARTVSATRRLARLASRRPRHSLRPRLVPSRVPRRGRPPSLRRLARRSPGLARSPRAALSAPRLRALASARAGRRTARRASGAVVHCAPRSPRARPAPALSRPDLHPSTHRPRCLARAGVAPRRRRTRAGRDPTRPAAARLRRPSISPHPRRATLTSPRSAHRAPAPASSAPLRAAGAAARSPARAPRGSTRASPRVPARATSHARTLPPARFPAAHPSPLLPLLHPSPLRPLARALLALPHPPARASAPPLAPSAAHLVSSTSAAQLPAQQRANLSRALNTRCASVRYTSPPPRSPNLPPTHQSHSHSPLP